MSFFFRFLNQILGVAHHPRSLPILRKIAYFDYFLSEQKFFLWSLEWMFLDKEDLLGLK